MQLRISKAVGDALGENKLRAVGQEKRNTFRDYYEIDLASLGKTQIAELREWFEDLVKLDVKGPKTLIRDIDTWNKALTDAGTVKARTPRQFSTILTEYLRKVPGHRLYRRLDGDGLAHVGYYVNSIEYHPERKERDHYSPAYCTMQVMNIDLGGRSTTTINFHGEDAQGKTASESLVLKGYYPETEELRSDYLAETDRFNVLCEQVGLQCLAIGNGTDDLDGNPQGGSRWSNYNSYGSRGYPMMHDGAPSKVVIDVFQEGEKERSSRDSGHIDRYFWPRKKPNVEGLEDDADFLETDLEDLSLENDIEIPVHPFCATFDLRRHLRMKLHVNYLTEYVYDESMGDRLILPQVMKNLVTTLISQNKLDFADIIAEKGAGVCVLLVGEPGVGKTLTAEVFSEASKRPLYSIQAAQLGVDAKQVEEGLLRFLARGSRWNAVVLLDEADVYIRRRDHDMQHNAIVAAFLRILEYQSSVLFMATNMVEEVDDAIASRCVARIGYHRPGITMQEEIWKVLNAVNGSGISEDMIAEIVAEFDSLTGRDIKQLLKLASLVANNQDSPITMETIRFVTQFQPTKTELSATEGGGLWSEFQEAFAEARV